MKWDHEENTEGYTDTMMLYTTERDVSAVYNQMNLSQNIGIAVLA